MGGVAIQIIPDDVLFHHGIKGQQWGVRNGPPYPLTTTNTTKIVKVVNKVTNKLTSSQAITGRNPSGDSHNCKDVALTVARAYNGYGSDLIANEKSFVGNLHEFIENKFINGKDKVKSITGDSSNIQQRLTKQILKNCNDGDVGIVSISFDSKYIRNDAEEDGHAFNFFVENDVVKFKDGQPQEPLEDASKWFNFMNPNKEVEYCKVDDSLIPNEESIKKSMKRKDD